LSVAHLPKLASWPNAPYLLKFFAGAPQTRHLPCGKILSRNCHLMHPRVLANSRPGFALVELPVVIAITDIRFGNYVRGDG
jgi:hypothetical protein